MSHNELARIVGVGFSVVYLNKGFILDEGIDLTQNILDELLLFMKTDLYVTFCAMSLLCSSAGVG